MLTRAAPKILIATALFAFAWAVARATIQSITIDEASTYIYFASKRVREVWFGSSNNHVLNTLLMHAFTRVFRATEFTVRLPALIGAAIYIAACLRIVRRISGVFLIQWAVFVCLVFNPFVFDFLVAARGYSLALGFLLLALSIPLCSKPTFANCACASAMLGLSFLSNFSFAIADAVVFGFVVWWAGLAPTRLIACLLPAGAIGIFALRIFLKISKAELFWGTRSFGAMWYAIYKPSFLAFREFPKLGSALLIVLAFFAAACALFPGRDRKGAVAAPLWPRLGLIVLLILAGHAVAFYAFGYLLPRGRTGLFLAPLITLAIGALAAAPHGARWARTGFIASLAAVAVFFLCCLRLTYFDEWEYNADVKTVYPILARYNHESCVTDVAVKWMYKDALNFYRQISHRETFPEFVPINDALPLGKPLYVVHGIFDGDFVEQQHLRVVFHGSSDVVVAESPDFVASGQTCPPR